MKSVVAVESLRYTDKEMEETALCTEDRKDEPEASADAPAATSPLCTGFEYHVKMAVSIPSTWAELLGEVASHHYDAKCRESAKRGIVNALRNTACDSAYPSNHPLGWRDFDLLAKIMEQAPFHTRNPTLIARAAAIVEWIRQSKQLCLDRENALEH